jgi:single-strand DNA-binding protein
MFLKQLPIVGFTGRDAEIHHTANGAIVTTLSVATKESWKDSSGEWRSRSEWHRVVTFGKLAEYARSLNERCHVLVQGTLRTREYEKDGIKHRTVELRAETIAKLDRAERQDAREADAAAYT